MNRISPDWAPVLHELARLHATCPDARFRNGPQAVKEASRAIDRGGGTNPVALDTLAAAHAEAGDFTQAIAVQEVAVARTSGPQAASLKARLALYRDHQPYRDGG